MFSSKRKLRNPSAHKIDKTDKAVTCKDNRQGCPQPYWYVEAPTRAWRCPSCKRMNQEA